MTNTEAAELVVRLICRIRQVDASQLSEAVDLVDDLGFDSLDAAELLAAIHKETGRQLDMDSVKGMHTVRDVAEGLMGQRS